ncbi:conserved protein [Tepidicaulis marinus]|uniref:Conserved protein n=2 Tax=Tepidicaulis marinus TaxID=1333998 RepID=A0A081BAK3_9HYPH|nr:conserved protein [Tepidicaulis marinus]
MSNEDYELALAKVEEAIPSQHKAWVLSRLTYGNEISLSQRIRFLLNYFGDIFGDKSARRKLCWKIVNTRNYLTHYDEGLADEAAKGMQIWVLCRKMETLLQLHLLKELKFSDERIKQIALKSLDMKHALDLKMAKA